MTQSRVLQRAMVMLWTMGLVGILIGSVCPPNPSRAHAAPASQPVGAFAQGAGSEQELFTDPDSVHELARRLAGQGEYQKAAALLLPYLSEPLKYPSMYSDYLVILTWDGRKREALRRFESLPAHFPKRSYLVRNMARAYYDDGNFSSALSLYRDALESSPEDGEARKGLIMSLIRLNRLDEALLAVEGFLADDPVSTPLGLSRAEILVRMGRHVEALKDFRRVAAQAGPERESGILSEADELIESLPVKERAPVLASFRKEAEGGGTDAIWDYIWVLCVTADYEEAVSLFERAHPPVEGAPLHVVRWLAWAHFKVGDAEQGEALFQRVLALRPNDVKAQIGLSYCLASKGKTEDAISLIDALPMEKRAGTEVRFARAFAWEKARRFWDAILEYEAILEMEPHNLAAKKLRIRAWSDLGARSYGLCLAQEDLPVAADVHNDIFNDMAVDRLRWDEPERALRILEPLARSDQDQRAWWDYMLALAESEAMTELVNAYELSMGAGMKPPQWIVEAVAGAYLYLEEPEKALVLYESALKADPGSHNARWGKFDALQEVRKWKEARALLEEIDTDTPAFDRSGPRPRPNWGKLDVALARGWLLAYEGRLEEAEDYFMNLHEQAPANVQIRSGLAHVALWRGWPRKALKEFEVVEALDQDFYKARIGEAAALNESGERGTAREVAADLAESHPRDKQVQSVVRSLQVEEMRLSSTDFVFARDSDEVQEVRFETSLSQPLSLDTSLYGFALWQESKEKDRTSHFERAGAGIEHRFGGWLTAREQISANYDDGKDPGSQSTITLYPNDYLRFKAMFDSFTTDVPMRARAFDIEAKKLWAEVVFRESEQRSLGLSASRHWFSDDNERDQVLLGYEQELMNRGNWRMRFFVDLYGTRNSKMDVPYFNPERGWSVSGTQMIEQTLWRIYEKVFVHRIYLSLGSFKQSGYSYEPVFGLRYEQDYEFSMNHALLWGIGLSRNAYDGEEVNGMTLYASYKWRF